MQQLCDRRKDDWRDDKEEQSCRVYEGKSSLITFEHSLSLTFPSASGRSRGTKVWILKCCCADHENAWCQIRLLWCSHRRRTSPRNQRLLELANDSTSFCQRRVCRRMRYSSSNASEWRVHWGLTKKCWNQERTCWRILRWWKDKEEVRLSVIVIRKISVNEALLNVHR